MKRGSSVAQTRKLHSYKRRKANNMKSYLGPAQGLRVRGWELLWAPINVNLNWPMREPKFTTGRLQPRMGSLVRPRTTTTGTKLFFFHSILKFQILQSTQRLLELQQPSDNHH